MDLFEGLPITLAEQMAEVERELRLRATVYRRRVEQGRLTQDAADRQIAAMRAVLETLRGLQRLEHVG